MRIALLLDAYTPVANGITHFVTQHARALVERGHEPTVFTWSSGAGVESGPGAPGAPGAPGVPDEPRVVRSPALARLGQTGYVLGLRYTARAQAMLASMDLVHVHHPFLAGLMALRYTRARGIPLIYTNHTRYDLYAGHYARLPRDAAHLLVGRYLAYFCARCDRVVAPAAGLADVLRGLGVRTPIAIVGNGVELARFAPHGDRRARARAALGFAPGDRVAIYTGRLGPEKNLEFLLAAFAVACGAARELRLVLVGGGPRAEALRARAQALGVAGRVRFAGPVGYDDIPRWLALSDLFVTASLSEVHPLSVIEALAAGLPVLGVDAPGVREVVVGGVNGLLAPHDVPSFAAGLVRLAHDDGLRARLAAGAGQGRAAFDIARATDAYLAHYEQLIRRRDRQPAPGAPRSAAGLEAA